MRVLILLLFSISAFGQINSTLPYNNSFKHQTTKTESFISHIQPTRYTAGNPVSINDGTYLNICPAGMVTDPLDTSRFLLYRGEFIDFSSANARIGLIIGNKSNPKDLSNYYGPVITKSVSGQDATGIRFGGCVANAGTIYYYYVGVDNPRKYRIFLATSTDGRTFTKQGLVLDYNNTDEKSVSDPTVIIDNGVWYMTYTAWDGVTSYYDNPGAGKVGMKLATSTDGINWTKTNTVLIPLGLNGQFDDNYIEGGQLIKVGNQWFILYNGNDGSIWTIGFASGTSLSVPLVKSGAPYFSKGVTGWDNGTVACPLYEEIRGRGYFYYQAASVTDADHVDIGIAELIPSSSIPSNALLQLNGSPIKTLADGYLLTH